MRDKLISIQSNSDEIFMIQNNLDSPETGSIFHQPLKNLLFVGISTLNIRQVSINYMSPPAGDIYCSSLRVCPSVRPSVPCPGVTLPLSEPYLQEPFMEKIEKNFINNIFTEVVQQKIKIQFCQKFKKFWPKNHFLNLCFV